MGFRERAHRAADREQMLAIGQIDEMNQAFFMEFRSDAVEPLLGAPPEVEFFAILELVTS